MDRPLNKGYILLDILLGLFIFGLGFAVVLGVINTAALANGQAENYLQAVNLAASGMDELRSKLEENGSSGYAYFSGQGKDKIGNFERSVSLEWESVDLLLITVRVTWLERGEVRDYYLESLHYVQQE